MFHAIGSPAGSVTIHLDGQPVTACLLRHGVTHFRTTPVSAAPRLPLCMIGHRFECLVEIEGSGSRQACLIQVRNGMRIRRQEGAARIALEPTP